MAAICPDVFCEPSARAAVKRLLREAAGNPLAYPQVAEQTVPIEPNAIALEHLENINPFDLPGLRSPVERHQLILDHTEEPLEPIYFNLLDELTSREGWKVTKLTDTTVGTSLGGFGADLTRRVLQERQAATEQLRRLQTELRGLIQQWQQWREEKELLKTYETAKGPEGAEQETALWTLQTRWRRSTRPDVQVDALRAAAEFERWRQYSEVELRQHMALGDCSTSITARLPDRRVRYQSVFRERNARNIVIHLPKTKSAASHDREIALFGSERKPDLSLSKYQAGYFDHTRSSSDNRIRWFWIDLGNVWFAIFR